MEPIRVLLAEEEALLRALLRDFLNACPGIKVVAAPESRREALRCAQDLSPDVALVGVPTPGPGGMELARDLAESAPSTRVAILAGQLDDGLLLAAVRAGAAGFLLRQSPPQEVETAVLRLAGGEPYFTPWAFRIIAERLRGLLSRSPADALSPRKREILRLLAEGKTIKEIAYELGLSPKTAYMHRTELMAQLSLCDLPSLIRYAREAAQPPDGQ